MDPLAVDALPPHQFAAPDSEACGGEPAYFPTTTSTMVKLALDIPAAGWGCSTVLS